MDFINPNNNPKMSKKSELISALSSSAKRNVVIYDSTQYIMKENKYVPALLANEKENTEHFTPLQVSRINNLLWAVKEFQDEIERIKNNPKHESNERIIDSKLSGRAQNVCLMMLDMTGNGRERAMISDIANIPLKTWHRARGMGISMFDEIKEYLTNKGFNLIK